MTRHAYPWMKLQKDTKRDPAIVRLTLEQQAVFYNLLQHAGLQDEEGAFEVTDLETLALEVAQERVDLLESTIAQLLKYRVLTQLPDGRAAFANYEKHQATSKDVNAARQRRFYSAQKDQGADAEAENLTPTVRLLTPSNGDSLSFSSSLSTTESINAREEEPNLHHPLSGPIAETVPAPIPEDDELEQALDLLHRHLGVKKTMAHRDSLRYVIRTIPEVDPVAHTLSLIRWAEDHPPDGGDRRNYVLSWQKGMVTARDNKWDLRSTPTSSRRKTKYPWGDSPTPEELERIVSQQKVEAERRRKRNEARLASLNLTEIRERTGAVVDVGISDARAG